MSLKIPKPLEDLSEQEFDGLLFRGDKSVAAMLGWRLRYHTLRSKGSKAGFPDRVLVRDRIVYVETKSMTGKPTAEQRDWLDSLVKAGGETYLWKPTDWDEIAQVLSKRWTFDPNRGMLTRLENASQTWWQPDSIWLDGTGRADTVREPLASAQTMLV